MVLCNDGGSPGEHVRLGSGLQEALTEREHKWSMGGSAVIGKGTGQLDAQILFINFILLLMKGMVDVLMVENCHQ